MNRAARPAADAEIRAALEHQLAADGAIVRIDRRPLAEPSSQALEELEVRLAGGREMRLVFKDLGREALLASARGVRPDFLRAPRREIDVYRTVLAGAGLGTARCYGAVEDPRRGRYWLFLERVPGVPLWQVGEFSVWRRAARWLARLHAAVPPDAARPARPVIYDARYYRRWLRRARGFAAQAPVARAVLDGLAATYGAVVARLAALPAVFLHGEYYPSNVLVGPAARICPVDWETAALGPGVVDLAALVAGTWSQRLRTNLARTYRTESARSGGRPQAEGDFFADLDCARLHLAVQWLGWSGEWTPPVEHAHDWLGDVVELTRRLGL